MSYVEPHLFSQCTVLVCAKQLLRRTPCLVRVGQASPALARHNVGAEAGKPASYGTAVAPGRYPLPRHRLQSQRGARRQQHRSPSGRAKWPTDALASLATCRAAAFRRLPAPAAGGTRFYSTTTASAVGEYSPESAAAPRSDAGGQPRRKAAPRSNAGGQPRRKAAPVTASVEATRAGNKQLIYLKNNHSADRVLALFLELKRDGVANASTYSIVFDALARGRSQTSSSPTALLSFWDDYRKLDGWDKRDNDFIRECILCCLSRAALDVHKKLVTVCRRKEEALKANVRDEGQLTNLDEEIRSHQACADHWSALALNHFREIVKPTSDAFVYALSCATGKAGTAELRTLIERATEVYGCFPPALYPYVIESYGKAGMLEEALRCFGELQSKPNVTYIVSRLATSAVIQALLSANRVEDALAHAKTYLNFLVSKSAVDIAIAAVEQGKIAIACASLETLKLAGRALGSDNLAGLLGPILESGCDDISAPVIKALLAFDQKEPVVREFINALLVANIEKGNAYAALKAVSILADNDVLPPTPTLAICLRKNAETPEAKELLLKTLLTISRTVDTILKDHADASSVKDLCLDVSESLAQQFRDNLTFILMRARLDPDTVHEAGEKFFAQNTLSGEEDHQLAFEMAYRMRDDERIIKVAEKMRKSKFLPPGIGCLHKQWISRALEKDPPSYDWWQSRATILPSVNITNPLGYKPVLDDPDNPTSLPLSWGESRGYVQGKMLYTAARGDDTKDVVDLFESTVKSNKITYELVSGLFAQCGVNKDFPTAQRLAKVLNDAGMNTTITEERDRLRMLARTGLAIACVVGKHHNTARELLTNMTTTEKLLPPDANVYGLYLSHLDSGNDAAEAGAIHQEVNRLRLKPDAVYFASLLKKYIFGGKPEMVLQLIREVRKENVKPSNELNAVAILAATRIDNERLASFIFHEAQLHGNLSWKAIDVLMRYYLQTYRNRAQVEKLWKMASKVRQVDSVYESVLFARALLLPTDMPGAVDMFERIEKPNGKHYAAMISGFAKLGDFATAEAWLDRMNGKRENSGDAKNTVDMHWNGYEALITSYCAHGEVEAAARVHRRLLDDFGPDMNPDFADNYMLRGLAYRIALDVNADDVMKHVRAAEDLFEKAANAKAGAALRVSSYPASSLAMITIYLLAGRHYDANVVYKMMSASRSCPANVLRNAENLLLNQKDLTFARNYAIRSRARFL